MKQWRWGAFLMVIMMSFLIFERGGVTGSRPNFSTFAAEGVQIRYLVQGSGTPVALIHGLNSSAMINWKMPGIVDRLAAHFQVIALDLPGHGGSDKPDNAEAYGLQMVEDIILLLDQLHVEKAHIVGYSMGGMIALKLVSLHPERVISGVLGGMGWLEEGSSLQNVWESRPTRKGRLTPSACIQSLGSLAISEKKLKMIKTPMVILVGDHDPVKRLYVDPLHRVRNDWPIIVIEGAGHLNCLAQEKFVEALLSWLQQGSLEKDRKTE